jgi:hypothetical protein
VAGGPNLTASELATGITDAVVGFQHGTTKDDIAIVTLRRPPVAPT